MQASQSGFFVHITHEIEDGVDLRLHEAKAFLKELEATIGQVESHHTAFGEVGRDVSGAPVDEGAEVMAAPEEVPAKKKRAPRKSRAKKAPAAKKTKKAAPTLEIKRFVLETKSPELETNK